MYNQQFYASTRDLAAIFWAESQLNDHLVLRSPPLLMLSVRHPRTASMGHSEQSVCRKKTSLLQDDNDVITWLTFSAAYLERVLFLSPFLKKIEVLEQ